MNVVKAGSIWRIYGDDLATFKTLPAKTYRLCFSKFSGFFLETHPDLEVNEEKVYGVHTQKIDKVMNAFKTFERSLGVILSGDKGIGKSLFARMTCLQAQKLGLPVIVVNDDIPGLPDFITSIEQEVVVLFDEFDKTFSNNKKEDEASSQAALLSLFDGIAPGKKLYIITCNNIHSMNDYLINRPGRFHYHFRFAYPTAEEVRVYLQDKIDEKYYPEIQKVVDFSARIKLNYDCLRAIAFELDNGESFADAIKDLNILNTENQRYDIAVNFSDGLVLEDSVSLDMFSTKQFCITFRDHKHGNEDVYVRLIPSDAQYDSSTRSLYFDNTMIDVAFEYQNYDEDDGEKKRIYPEPVFVKATVSKMKDYAF